MTFDSALQDLIPRFTDPEEERAWWMDHQDLYDEILHKASDSSRYRIAILAGNTGAPDALLEALCKQIPALGGLRAPRDAPSFMANVDPAKALLPSFTTSMDPHIAHLEGYEEQMPEHYGDKLLEQIDKICRPGVNILAYPSHHGHFLSTEIAARCEAKGVRFVSFVDATVNYVRKTGISELALFGPSIVCRAYALLLGNIRVHLPPDEAFQEIDQLEWRVRSDPTANDVRMLRRLLRECLPKDCSNVLMAMPELCANRGYPIFSRWPRVVEHVLRLRDGILIDPLKHYAEAIAREYVCVRKTRNDWI